MLVVSKTGTNLASEKGSAAAIAQFVEHLICNQRVGSSSLSGGTTLPQQKQYDSDLSQEAPFHGLHLRTRRGYIFCSIVQYLVGGAKTHMFGLT